MNNLNPCATAANAQEIAPANAAVATANNEPTLYPLITAIANGIAVLTQNLNNLAAAVNATYHLNSMINQGPPTGGGGGGAGGGGGGGGPGGGGGGGPVPFALSPGHAEADLVIDYHKYMAAPFIMQGKRL